MERRGSAKAMAAAEKATKTESAPFLGNIQDGKVPLLKKSSRRPSVPLTDQLQAVNTVTAANSKPSRLQQRELMISQQGWLNKHSRGGLTKNWNVRGRDTSLPIARR